jgi:hypothetical protein
MADIETPEVGVSADVPPTLETTAPWAVERLKGTDKAREALEGKEAALSQSEGDLAVKRETGLAPLRAGAEATVSQPLPSAPGMSPLPDAPSGPIIDPEHFKSFAAIAFPFALLLGKAMRADAFDGLNMLSSSVQGYVQGRKEEAASKLQQFQSKMQKVTHENQQKLSEYRALLERRDLETQQKMQLLSIAAQKYDDAQTYYASQRKSIADIHKQLDRDDANTIKLANASIKVAAEYQKNLTAREHWEAMESIAKQRIQKMGSMRKDAETERKLTWIQGKQIALYQTFMAKMQALDTKILPAQQRKLAETQLRNWFAGAMKNTNEIARREGFTVPPETEAMENPANDPLGPTSTPDSEAESQSFFRSLWGEFGKMFGHNPGVNPGVTPAAPPQGPTQGGGWSATPR